MDKNDSQSLGERVEAALFSPIEIDLKALLKAMAKALVDARAANWDTLQKDIVDMATAVGIEMPTPKYAASEQAARLISVALNRGVFDLIRDHKHLFGYGLVDPAGGVPAGLEVEIDEVFTSTDGDRFITIEPDPDLFDRPACAPQVEALHEPLTAWFVDRGLDAQQARSIAIRSGHYFAAALAHEWRENESAYGDLQAHLGSAATPINMRRRDWQHYRTKLMRRIEEPLFADSFSLNQVFQPLRAYYAEYVGEARTRGRGIPVRHGATQRKLRRMVIDGMSALSDWLRSDDTEDAIRVISGGPGAGKSSFALMLAANRAEAGDRVLLIELHLFTFVDDLETAINRFAKRELFRHEVLAHRSADPLLLIFDGLDELSIRGPSGGEVVRRLCDNLRDLLASYNRADLRVRAVLLGREVVVQSIAHRYRRTGQVLHLLPYFVSPEDRSRYHDPHQLLGIDQRQGWWRDCGTYTGVPWAGLPSVLARVDTLTAQPLLNYLVAIALRRGDVDFGDEDTSLNDVYRSLIEQVFKRVHASRRYAPEGPGQPLRDLDDISINHYRAFLRCVAVEAWHGEGRTATMGGIRHRLQKTHLGKLELLQQFAEVGLSRLIAAFYFREIDEDVGEKCFEFTHQSFAEFLVADEIVTFVALLRDESIRHTQTLGSGWGADVQLAKWIELFGASPLQPNVCTFIREALGVQADIDLEGTAAIGRVLSDLLAHIQEGGLPLDAMPGVRRLEQAQEVFRNAVESLLLLISVVAEMTETLGDVGVSDDPLRFGQLIAQLQRPADNGGRRLGLSRLSHLDLGGAVLRRLDLRGVDLRGTHLAGAEIYGVDLCGARLDGAFLRGARLSPELAPGDIWPDFTLEYSCLASASLIGADLRDAYLSGVQLSGANLTGARLRRANLKRAEFWDTSLIDADLTDADLREAKMQVFVDGADLSGADLSGATVIIAELASALLFPPFVSTPRFTGARFDTETKWPDEFDPAAAGVVLIDGAALRLHQESPKTEAQSAEE